MTLSSHAEMHLLHPASEPAANPDGLELKPDCMVNTEDEKGV
jgi:hypothetical protein